MPIDLPNLTGISSGLRRGRSVYEGYQRGWGLQFGDLPASIRRDPVYQGALRVSEDRSIMSEERKMNLFLLLTCFVGRLACGDVFEFGSYRGGSALFMAYVARQVDPRIRVFALDTFEGMPETDRTVDAHSTGDFVDADYGGLLERIRDSGLDNLIPIKGRFDSTASAALRACRGVCLAHIDCDIASAVKYSYECVLPRMVPGGYIVFDDATVSSCIGATEVVEDVVIRRDGMNSEQIWPHFVFRAPLKAS